MILCWCPKRVMSGISLSTARGHHVISTTTQVSGAEFSRFLRTPVMKSLDMLYNEHYMAGSVFSVHYSNGSRRTRRRAVQWGNLIRVHPTIPTFYTVHSMSEMWPCDIFFVVWVHSLGPGDATWWHGSASALISSLCLKQCWLFLNGVFWHPPESKFT